MSATATITTVGSAMGPEFFTQEMYDAGSTVT